MIKSLFTLLVFSFLFVCVEAQAVLVKDSSSSSSSTTSSPKNSYTPTESLMVSHESHQPSAEEKAQQQTQREVQIYSKVKDKSWDQLSSKEKKYAQKNGIADAAAYDAWKAKVEPLYVEQQTAKSLKIYTKYKLANKSWDQLSSKEKQFAKKNGIPDAATYDAWKIQMAAALEVKKAKQAEAKQMKQAKESLKIYKKYKLAGKSWDDLSSKEKAFAKKKGIGDAAAYEAWKVQMETLIAQEQQAGTGTASAPNGANLPVNSYRSPSSVIK